MMLVIILRIGLLYCYTNAKDTDNHFCKDCSKYLWIKGYEVLFLMHKLKCPNEKIIINELFRIIF